MLAVCVRQHTSAHVSTRQHTSAHISTRQHTSGCLQLEEEMRDELWGKLRHVQRSESLLKRSIRNRVPPQRVEPLPQTHRSASRRVSLRCALRVSLVATPFLSRPSSIACTRRARASLHPARPQAVAWSWGIETRLQHLYVYCVRLFCITRRRAKESKKHTSAYVSIR